MNEILIVPTRTGHNTKKILENGKNLWKSGNFVSPEKWEPWRRSEIKYFHCFHIFRLERSRTWPGLSRGKHLCNEEIRTQCKNTVTVNIIQTTWKDIFVHALDESGNFEVGFGPSQENILFSVITKPRSFWSPLVSQLRSAWPLHSLPCRRSSTSRCAEVWCSLAAWYFSSLESPASLCTPSLVPTT